MSIDILVPQYQDWVSEFAKCTTLNIKVKAEMHSSVFKGVAN